MGDLDGYLGMSFSGVLSIPKTTTKANQRSYRKGEKERAHHKWDTNNQIASLHNKNDERDDGYQNDGIDASWEETILSDDSMIGHFMLEAAPVIIHFISASPASNTLPIQRSSHAKNIMNLTCTPHVSHRLQDETE